ncbi:MAG: transposase [Chloroflexi bacterium]|nr:transposase [Chloroflexota bacterium]
MTFNRYRRYWGDGFIKKRLALGFFHLVKPTNTVLIESFDGRFRDECLHVNWFLSFEDAKNKIGAWVRD